MGKAEQAKGQKAEFELSRKLNEYGYHTAPEPPLSFGGVPDVTGLPGVHVECKRQENPDILAALQQAATDAERFQDGLPVVFCRKNRGKWVAFLTLESFIELYRNGIKSTGGGAAGKESL